jgi:hypothetical protein
MSALTYTAKRELVNDSAGFVALFNDAGNGAVDTSLWRGTGPATFTRATTATTVGIDGLVKGVASGMLRSYYDPSSLIYVGCLIESFSTTNIALRSEEFDNAAWTKTRSSVSANATTAPDGTATADKIVEDSTASSTHTVNQSIAFTSGNAYTFSCWFKAAGRTFVEIVLPTAVFGMTRGSFFNLSTGALGANINSVPGRSIQAFPNGWYRCSITDTATATTSGTPTVFLASADNVDSYSGDGSSGIYAWGAQVEISLVGALPSSYVPTTTATVTRNADVLKYPTTGNILGTIGTCYMEATALGTGVGQQLLLDPTAGSGRTPIYRNSTNNLGIYDGTNGPSDGSINTTGVTKVATSWGGAGQKACVGGGAVTAAAFDGDYTISADMQIANDNTVRHLPYVIKNLRIYSTQASDAVLQQMTTAGTDYAHLPGTSYSIDFGAEQLDRSRKREGSSQVPIGGGAAEVTLYRNDRFDDVRTSLLTEAQVLQWDELLASASAGELMTWDKYGTVAVPDKPVSVQLESESHGYVREGSSFAYRVALKLRLV